MADVADRANDLADMQRATAIRDRARSNSMNGPSKCLRCQSPNDRAGGGYAVCTDCFEGS